MAVLSERQMRHKFRQDAQKDPNVLLYQFVNLTSSGPAYKVTNLKQMGAYNEWYAHLAKRGWVQLFRINYYSGDLINLHQSRIDNITKTMKD